MPIRSRWSPCADDTFWIGDEFGPWLLHFSIDGELLGPPIELPDAVYSPDHPLCSPAREGPRWSTRADSRRWTWPATDTRS